MNDKLRILWLFTILFISVWTGLAQNNVYSLEISKTKVNVRGNKVVLGQLLLNFPYNGKAVVQFSGICISDPGDGITVAANTVPDWGVNDGNVSFEAIDSDVNRNSFSHTRIFDVSAGFNSFYAVAENYTPQNGSGIASFYGHLVVKYFPDIPFTLGLPLVRAQNISQTRINVRGNPVKLDSITLTSKFGGTVYLRFDGQCVPDIGDRIILAASDNGSWSTNDGGVAAETPDKTGFSVPFSHSRVYTFTGGSKTFYAVAENYVETAGSGVTSIYGTLTLEFYPSVSGVECKGTGISRYNINLRGNPVALDSIQFNFPTPGKVFVYFDGFAFADIGDRLLFAASDHIGWTADAGNTTIEVPNSDQNHANFAHAMVYDVTPGPSTFYAISQNYVETDGSGVGSVYGNLCAVYFPDNTVGLEDEENMIKGFQLYQNYPNPFNPTTMIRYDIPTATHVDLSVYSVTGQKMMTLISGEQNPGSYIIEWNGGSLPSGIYFITLKTKYSTKSIKAVLMK